MLDLYACNDGFGAKLTNLYSNRNLQCLDIAAYRLFVMYHATLRKRL